MIQSPKAHFLANAGACKTHADTIHTSAFQEALQSALLQYSSECARETGPDAGYWKTRGAFEFSRVLCTLHVPAATRTHVDHDNLE